MARPSEETFPRYAEVWLVNLDPAQGPEIGKRRPALVVSNTRTIGTLPQ